MGKRRAASKIGKMVSRGRSIVDNALAHICQVLFQVLF